MLQTEEYTDNTVVANKEYQYRVTAENEGGESQPSEPSDPIKARPLKGNISQTGIISLYLVNIVSELSLILINRHIICGYFMESIFLGR